MNKIKVKKKAAMKLKKGYPLVSQEDLLQEVFSQQDFPKDWVTFTTESNEYVATGYLGHQNKGIGWVLSRNMKEEINGNFFQKKFREAFEKRQSLLQDTETTAFRLFNGEGDGIGGIIVDDYEGFLVISWYNGTIYQFKEMILASLLEIYPEVKGVYEKNRFGDTTLPESQHLFGKKAPEPLLVKENGITYATYLNEGLMTGFFLDQREVRGALATGLAAGKSVLNTFSYTGAFSVAASYGGAAETTSVDLAKRSLPKTQEQFQVNGLPLENHKIYVMDVFEYFKYANRKSLSYDMIVLDPPSFARNKKRTFSVAKNYGQLVADVLPILNQRGLLVASTNAANVSKKKFQEMVEEALKSSQRSFKLLEEYHLPADFVVCQQFPEGDYLKVLIYQVD